MILMMLLPIILLVETFLNWELRPTERSRYLRQYRLDTGGIVGGVDFRKWVRVDVRSDIRFASFS